MTKMEWFKIDHAIRLRQHRSDNAIERECLHLLGLAVWDFWNQTNRPHYR